MLGNRTQGDRMECADESTELWQHPIKNVLAVILTCPTNKMLFDVYDVVLIDSWGFSYELQYPIFWISANKWDLLDDVARSGQLVRGVNRDTKPSS